MITKKQMKSTIRVTLLLFSFWLLGILLSVWYGLGWFFLSETVRRIIMAVPQTYIPFLRVFVSDERADEEKYMLSQKNVRMVYSWRIGKACIWILLTIYVFLKINIRLISLFT